MTDQERKDLAVAYRTMMDQAAWKHFSGMLSRLKELATKNEDEIPAHELDKSIGFIGECRGRRSTIDKINTELDYILNG